MPASHESRGVLGPVYPVRNAAAEDVWERAALWLRGEVSRRWRAGGSRSVAERRLAGALARFDTLDGAGRAQALRQARRSRVLRPVPGRSDEDTLGVVAAVASRAWPCAPAAAGLPAALAMVRGEVAAVSDPSARMVSACLAACTAAMGAVAVHLVCRDPAQVGEAHARLEPLCDRLGVSLSAVGNDMSLDRRREAYRHDLVCVAASELAMDALRDARHLADAPSDLQLRLERLHAAEPRLDRLILRGRSCAILVDADRILIDQALNTVALGAEQPGSDETRALALACDVACLLVTGREFALDDGGWPVLTAAGRARLESMLHQQGGPWSSPRWREELVTLALLARHCLREHAHYRQGARGIELVDASVQRRLGSEHRIRMVLGLLAIEAGVRPAEVRGRIASASYLQTFRRYALLGGGLSYADPDLRREIWQLYRLQTVGAHTPPVAARAPVTIGLLPDEEALSLAVAGAARAARQAAGTLLVAMEDADRAAALERVLEGAGLGCRVVGPHPAGAQPRRGGRSCDVLIAVGGEALRLLADTAASGAIVSLRCVGAPRERRAHRERLHILGERVPGVPVRQLLTLEDALLQREFHKALARGVLRVDARLPAAGRFLASWLYRFVLGRSTRAIQDLRREHRTTGARIEKLLAFSGVRQ